MAEEEPAKKKTSRGKKMLYALGFFILMGILVFVYWWFFMRNKEWTDDAYVHGNRILINAQVEGTASAFFVDDNDFVKEGQLLVTLDPTQYQITLKEELATLANTCRMIKSLQDNVIALSYQIVVQEKEVEKTRYDYVNRKALAPLQAIPAEDVEHARIFWEEAINQLKNLKYTFFAQMAQLGSTPLEEHPQILAQKEVVRRAFVNLTRCNIYSPSDGYVAKRFVQVGEWVTTTYQLMSVVPEDQLWVEANFKETKLYNVRVGQPVKVTFDMWGGDVVFDGVVQGIQMGSGSAFSLLPAQNATGNWIKIIQRVPTRISIKKEDLKKHPLRIGLSAYVTVDTTDVSGSQMRPFEEPRLVHGTDVLAVNMLPVNRRMSTLMEKNLSYPDLSDE